MDAARKRELCGWLGELAERGSAALVATHDVEFAARLASRVVLLGDGELIADGPADEILSGGWYFATEVARILGAAGAITPEQGAALLGTPATSSASPPGVRARAQDEERRMSWQAVTFAGLALVLVGGFWWYERTRPSARLVALVAALAALAVAGRLVLAPIPNVVATTDIALITGYALGAGPGLRRRRARGADLEHLARPGAVDGLADGGLGAGRPRRRLARDGHRGAGSGRLGLATVCALAGFAYGALLDLSVMVTYGGEQSLDRYLALSARGIPFNVAHAAGNFVIALAAGPALVRMISRFRTRADVHLAPGRGALPLAAAGAASPRRLAATAPPPARGQADRPSAWLARRARTPTAASPRRPGSRRARR